MNIPGSDVCGSEQFQSSENRGGHREGTESREDSRRLREYLWLKTDSYSKIRQNREHSFTGKFRFRYKFKYKFKRVSNSIMCGICGFTGKGTIQDLELMTDTMFHRGPDDKGVWHDPEKAVYMGHRRLSIIDIADGAQPMWTADNALGVVFNGEIYNHTELRNELQNKGHIFQSDHSDTEVLLHGFREWETDMPNRLNGMWAFAIYDRNRNILFLSRDRFGKKPLFYTLQNNTFAYASELTALTMHSHVESSVSRRSLKKYFAYGYIPAPGSLYDRVYKLPGGHNLIFNLNDFSVKVDKYWDFVLEPFESVPENPEEEWGGTTA